MAFLDHIPLMKSGHTKRNILAGLLLIWFLWLTPIYLLYAVGTNRNGLGDSLASSPLGRLPGISKSGWTASVAVFGYSLFVLILLSAAMGGGDGGAEPAEDLTIDDPGEDVPDTGDGDEGGIEQIASETYDESGLTTGLSYTGDTVLFGFQDGNVMIYDDDRDGEVIQLGVDRSVSHIEVRENANTAVLGWMDAHMFGPFDLTDEDGPLVEHPGMWDIDTTPDADAIVSVSHPFEGTGSVGLAEQDGTVQWETEFDDAAGLSVAITDDGNHVAVGAAHYWDTDGDLAGTPAVKLYDGDGNEEWSHETEEDVLSIGIDAERELVVAGTDDGQTMVFDFDGNAVWQSDDIGGWVALSGDGGTVLSSETDGMIYAIDTETGDERWVADIGTWAAEDISVSDDGTRVLAADRGGGEVFVVDEGEVIWEASYEVGPALGAISGDGSTWSISIQDNDDRVGHVEIYRDT